MAGFMDKLTAEGGNGESAGKTPITEFTAYTTMLGINRALFITGF